MLAPLTTVPVTELNGDHDVFGDGSVVIKRAPGHTVGHQTLLLRLPNTGHILLSGDLVHCEENWRDNAVPALNVDQAQSLESIRRTRALLATEHATLWIQHDLGVYAQTRLAPGWYG